MTESEHTPYDPRLEAYLDEVMSEEERLAFEAELAVNPQLAVEVTLQSRLNASLVRLFPHVVVPVTHITAVERQLGPTLRIETAASERPRWPWLVGIASAAAAALLVFALGEFNSESGRTAHFAPKPLTQIFAKTVEEGFEPYYECKDEVRFAETFAHRQGVPLRLAKLPVGTMMKGLSYPGGLSRETTAMLGEVDGTNVMVFVDRAENDQAIAVQNSDPQLRVFREERAGLVFYEVTPLEMPRMTQYLQVADD